VLTEELRRASPMNSAELLAEQPPEQPRNHPSLCVADRYRWWKRSGSGIRAPLIQNMSDVTDQRVRRIAIGGDL
jgi:hypothetical protein